jgi:hypothetical protein
MTCHWCGGAFVPRASGQKQVYCSPHHRQLAKAQRAQTNFRAFLDTIKVEFGCVDCGFNAAPEALHFDHRDKHTKRFQVGDSATRSAESLWAEIAKCDVRCANCHSIRTKREQHFLTRRSA